MVGVEIIKVKKSELFALQMISRQTFKEAFSEDNTEEDMSLYLRESLSIEQLTKEIEDKNSAFYFAQVEHEIAAYLKVNYHQKLENGVEQNSLEIERVYVLQKFQGNKIGQLLFNKALELAKVFGANNLWLGVWEKNYKAIRFYEKNGMNAFDRKLFQLGKDKQTDILMRIELNSIFE